MKNMRRGGGDAEDEERGQHLLLDAGVVGDRAQHRATAAATITMATVVATA